jgi:chitodextrinase
MRKILIMMTIIAMGVCVTSCKAWRTISTSATYVQQNDTSKTTTTISTKTVEEYTGVKKN